MARFGIVWCSVSIYLKVAATKIFVLQGSVYTHLQRIKNDSRLLIFFSIPIRVNDLEGSVKQIFISLQIAKNDLEGSVEGTWFPMIFLAFKTDSHDLEG